MSILSGIICTIKAIPEFVTYEEAREDELDNLVEALRKTLWSMEIEQSMRDRVAARCAAASNYAGTTDLGDAS